MIYQGGAWPEEYNGKLFMHNIHGNRINIDQLIPEGSGYAGDRYPDFLLTGDKWSQMINLMTGPDGQVWMIDWYDANQCHTPEEGKHDTTNGRIFRVSYGEVANPAVDLKKLSNQELVSLSVSAPNEWHSRHARRLLQERVAAGYIPLETGIGLLFSDPGHPEVGETDIKHQMRFLWTMHVLISPEHIQEMIKDVPFEQFLKMAREAKEPLTYGSWGPGGSGHITGEALKQAAKIDLLHVPYNGTAPLLQGQLANQINCAVNTLPTVEPHIRSGTLRLLALVAKQRLSQFPDVPILKEMGIPIEIGGWIGFLAPAGVPADVLAKLHAAIDATAREPAIAEQMKSMTLVPDYQDQRSYQAFYLSEFDRWGQYVRTANIVLDQ